MHGRKKPQALAPSPASQLLHGLSADAPGRHIDHSAQVHIVVGVIDQVQVGHQVLDLTTLVEADAADEPVPGTLVQAGFFQGAGLGVDPVHDRAVAVLIPVLAYQPFGFRDNEGRFLSFVIGLPNLHQVPLGIVGEQVLLDALAVYGDKILGGVQDIRRRPVILVQSDGLGLRVVTLEAEDVADVRATPGVDRLVGVAHHADVLVGLS